MVQKYAPPAAKPRGRPRQYDPDEALRHATDAFWKSGYSGTSLDDITAATGMNRPSLSAAFGSKHALYLATLRAYWRFKLEAMQEALAGGTIQAALMRAYEVALSFYFSGGGEARGCFAVGTAVTEAVDDPEIREIVATGFRALDADFEARIRIALEAGEISKDADPEALAILASGAMQTISLRARTGTPIKELRRLAKKTIAAICR